MTTINDVATRFEKEIANHVLRVVHEDGLHRHLRCEIPRGHIEAGFGWFDIVTYPGHLVISGDMGCYVFSRLRDMFEFFRGERPNYGSWAEKLEAADKSCGYHAFSNERFEAAVREDVDAFIESNGLNDEDAAELRQHVDDEVLVSPNDAVEAINLASEFRFNRREVFPDFWEHNLDEYTFRFLWCCNAIQWAIRQYDGLGATREPTQAVQS
jgi:hypothetical protein